MKTDIQKEIIAIFKLLLINVVIVLLLIMSSFLIENISTFKNWKIYLLIYFILLVTFYILESRIKSKVISFILLILALPFGVFYYVGLIGIPYMILQVHLVIYLAFCFLIPALLYSLYEFLGYPLISTQLKVYLILSIAVMCSVIFQKQMKYLVHAFSPARLKTSEKLKPYNIEELSNYLLSENNIKFVVFVIYFVIIVIVNFYNFQDKSYYETDKIDKAVLQSFVTYIAFDRIISSLKQVEFKPSEMVAKMKNSILNKKEQLDNINKQ